MNQNIGRNSEESLEGKLEKLEMTGCFGGVKNSQSNTQELQKKIHPHTPTSNKIFNFEAKSPITPTTNNGNSNTIINSFRTSGKRFNSTNIFNNTNSLNKTNPATQIPQQQTQQGGTNVIINSNMPNQGSSTINPIFEAKKQESKYFLFSNLSVQEKEKIESNYEVKCNTQGGYSLRNSLKNNSNKIISSSYLLGNNSGKSHKSDSKMTNLNLKEKNIRKDSKTSNNCSLICFNELKSCTNEEIKTLNSFHSFYKDLVHKLQKILHVKNSMLEEFNYCIELFNSANQISKNYNYRRFILIFLYKTYKKILLIKPNSVHCKQELKKSADEVFEIFKLSLKNTPLEYLSSSFLYQLGNIYLEGIGTNVDEEMGIFYFILSKYSTFKYLGNGSLLSYFRKHKAEGKLKSIQKYKELVKQINLVKLQRGVTIYTDNSCTIEDDFFKNELSNMQINTGVLRENDNSCDICMGKEKEKETVFYPCKHAVCCLECTLKLIFFVKKSCPICRGNITMFH